MQESSKPRKGGAIVFFARLLNLQKDDRVAASIYVNGKLFHKNITQPLKKNKANYVTKIGRKFTPSKPFPNGVYHGVAQLVRGGKVIEKIKQSLELK